MKRSYQDVLDQFWMWMNTVAPAPECNPQPPQGIQNAVSMIYTIADGIADEYPYYSVSLKALAGKLFGMNGAIHIPNFAKLYYIIGHIKAEPVNNAIWTGIHPRIVAVSKNEFNDQYYDSAAAKAIKEVETRLRELFREIKPGQKEPRDVGACIGALLGENGALNVADSSTESGKNYIRGTKLIFEGAFAAYRNPEMHGNIPYTRRASYEQIVLASQMMYILDSHFLDAS